MGKAGMKVLRVFLAGIESRHWIPILMISGGGITHKAVSGVSAHLPEIQGGATVSDTGIWREL